MKYQEKSLLVDKAIEMIKEGSSREEVENSLLEEGVQSWDVKKIIQAVDSHFKRLYKDKIRSYMLDQSLESRLSEFDEMDADSFEQVQHQIIAEMQGQAKRKVKEMLDNKKSEKEIVALAANAFFDEEAVRAFIETETEQLYEEKNKGLTYIGFGVLLTIICSSLFENSIVVFYGLVVYGAVMFFRLRSY